MSRLIVSALSEDTIAAPGNRLSNYIIVSVSNVTSGAPISGLTAKDFKVEAMIVGLEGAQVNITSVTENARIGGFYWVYVVPIKAETWKAGVYIFAVAVTHGLIDKGQTVCSVLMD